MDCDVEGTIQRETIRKPYGFQEFRVPRRFPIIHSIIRLDYLGFHSLLGLYLAAWASWKRPEWETSEHCDPGWKTCKWVHQRLGTCWTIGHLRLTNRNSLYDHPQPQPNFKLIYTGNVTTLQQSNSCSWVITCDNGSALHPQKVAQSASPSTRKLQGCGDFLSVSKTPTPRENGRDVPSGIVLQNAKMGVEDTTFTSKQWKPATFQVEICQALISLKRYPWVFFYA